MRTGQAVMRQPQQCFASGWCLLCCTKVPLQQQAGHLQSAGHCTRVGAVNLSRRWGGDARAGSGLGTQSAPTQMPLPQSPSAGAVQPAPNQMPPPRSPGPGAEMELSAVQRLARRGGGVRSQAGLVAVSQGLQVVKAPKQPQSSHTRWRYAGMVARHQRGRLGPPQRVLQPNAGGLGRPRWVQRRPQDDRAHDPTIGVRIEEAKKLGPRIERMTAV